MMEPITDKVKPRLGLWTLSAANLASIAVAVYIVFSLDPEDKITVKRGLSLTALGLVYFSSMFELLNVVVLTTAWGVSFQRKYKITYGDVLDINNKVVSGVQAVLSCAAGAVVVGHTCPRDFMRSTHCMCDAYAWFGTAYFFYDIWSMYNVYVEMNRYGSIGDSDKSKKKANPAARTTFLQYCRYEPVILFHHLFIGGFGFVVIIYLRGGLGDCTFGAVYLMEASTPLVSARGLLARLRRQAGPLYVANGLGMLATFALCRIACLPYLCLLYSRAIQKPYFQAIQTLPIGCKISICLLLLPQLYWFYLMSMGAIKLLTSRGKKPMLSGGDAASVSDVGSESANVGSESARVGSQSGGDDVRKRS